MKLTRWVLGVCFVLSSLATYAQEVENKNVLEIGRASCRE